MTSTPAIAAAHRSNTWIIISRKKKLPVGIPTSSTLTSLPHIMSPTPSSTKAIPMVDINMMMWSWLTIGRSTTRSTRKARPTMTTPVKTIATNAGIPGRALSNANGTVPVIRPTSVIAANSANTPCAKLNTEEALKIKTKPKATSEYMTPVINPPITTSKKKAGESAISRNGATKTAVKTSISILS